MPKIVNHETRREQLAEAAWRIIRRKGLDAVSVRSVAEEAGMSLGSLRHYFATQSELLEFSMRLVTERITKRISNLKMDGDLLEVVVIAISQLVPIDEDRLAESEVWLSFTGKALSDPSLGSLNREMYDALSQFFHQIIHTLIDFELTKPGIDLELESKRLHALVDGLLVHGVTYPESVSSEDILRIVKYHLDSILRH